MKFVRDAAVATAFVPILTAAAILLSPYAASASQLIYIPINPNFGGSPFNGPFLIDQATFKINIARCPSRVPS